MEPQVKQYGSNMVMTNVYKQKKTKYLNIDTRFTDEYVYPANNFNGVSNYIITLPERINDVHSMKVRNVEIPMSFYNISTALGNNSFKIVNGATSNMVVLPDGIYSSSDISNSVYTRARPYLSNTNINTNQYFSMTGSGNYEVDFNTDVCGNMDKYNFRSKLGWLLGYRDVSNSLVSGTALIAPSMINTHSVRYLYLVVDEYNNSFPNTFICPQNQYLMNKKVLARISLDNLYPFGTIIHGNESNGTVISDNRVYSGKIDIQRLNIQLVNEWGMPINLNGLDFSFVLEIEYE
jgi:hypothetical protein